MYKKKKGNKREDNQEDELKIEHWQGEDEKRKQKT